MLRPRRASRAALLVTLLVAILVAACGTSTTSAEPTASAAPSVASSGAPASPAPPDPTPVPGSGDPATPVPSSQTDTEWGRIWDTLPAAFPHYPGSVPTETGEGPASGRFAVPVDARTAATFMQQALETAAYSTDALSGPLEDGGFVLDSTGEDPACHVRTTIAPLGSTTVMTVMYGAACPAP